MIREIGADLRGERELDASGCAVAPGFIDIHTHYDAQVFWDPALRPSSYHGVTTVVAGNCGFAIAPTRPEHHDVIVRTLENVEDMDPATLTAGIAWDFETFPEYLELGPPARDRRSTSPRTSGTRALRLYVMGDAAYERAATPDEIERMCALVARGDRRGRGRVLDQLLVRAPRRRRQAGAEPLRRARRGRGAVPRRRASAGKGVVLITPGRAVHLRRRLRVAAAHRAAVHLPAVRRRRAASTSSRARAARGGRWRTAREVWPQVTPRPLTMQFTMADPYSLNTGKVFGELLQGEPRRAHRRVPRPRVAGAGRGRPGAVADEAALGDVRGLRVGPRSPSCEGRRVDELARERGVSPLDVMCELAVAEDLADALPRLHRQRRRRRGRRTCSRTSSVALGLSDAGAHVDQLCDAPLPHRPARHVGARARRSCRSSRRCASSPASRPTCSASSRRGYLREGNWADVCVFDPADGRHRARSRRVRDFPADAERLTAEEPTGLRHVLVNGTPIRRDEVQLDTSVRPGMRPELG